MAACTGPRTNRKGLLDEVGEDDGGAVVGEAFDKFNKSDYWSGRRWGSVQKVVDRQALTICIPGYGICNSPQYKLLLFRGELKPVMNAVLDRYFRIVFLVIRIVRIESVGFLLGKDFLGMSNTS